MRELISAGRVRMAAGSCRWQLGRADHSGACRWQHRKCWGGFAAIEAQLGRREMPFAVRELLIPPGLAPPPRLGVLVHLLTSFRISFRSGHLLRCWPLAVERGANNMALE
jgi:hypothetical protein